MNDFTFSKFREQGRLNFMQEAERQDAAKEKQRKIQVRTKAMQRRPFKAAPRGNPLMNEHASIHQAVQKRKKGSKPGHIRTNQLSSRSC